MQSVISSPQPSSCVTITMLSWFMQNTTWQVMVGGPGPWMGLLYAIRDSSLGRPGKPRISHNKGSPWYQKMQNHYLWCDLAPCSTFLLLEFWSWLCSSPLSASIFHSNFFVPIYQFQVAVSDLISGRVIVLALELHLRSSLALMYHTWPPGCKGQFFACLVLGFWGGKEPDNKCIGLCGTWSPSQLLSAAIVVVICM